VRYRVDILTTDLGVLAPETTGLRETIQAAQVRVTGDRGSTPHVVVRSATPPFLLDSDDDAIRRLFPGVLVSLVHADVPGRTTISCFGAGALERSGAAAAVATLKRAWGGDESPTIAVTFDTGGGELRLDPIHEEGAWWVDVPG
jgi:hypothetical protein